VSFILGVVLTLVVGAGVALYLLLSAVTRRYR